MTSISQSINLNTFIGQFRANIRRGIVLSKYQISKPKSVTDLKINRLLKEFDALCSNILAQRNKKYCLIAIRSLLELFWQVEAAISSQDPEELMNAMERLDYELLTGKKYPLASKSSVRVKIPSAYEMSAKSRLKIYENDYKVLSGVVHMNPYTLRAIDRDRLFWYSYGLYIVQLLVMSILDTQAQLSKGSIHTSSFEPEIAYIEDSQLLIENYKSYLKNT
ncbi:MAG: hypothetical protein TR69_WS6001000055 [candidate division WS6 bacterium OLB20]|uniref:Uncharacterized protein n=1 Tax=candidate division WS6 bacterium OLB20 TaxID=1617426 RepID=A0A136M137_9BACT|nr:MAG: hypothetical protein TR69_WS6001000055 [candidate division WS6 bacterium OLB20]